ncbi:von Willebrand factor type A domain-containing protein [Asanoa hainanensis]|uniref:von Willebrand factor type A domain-containing protein n=1 Tax=Asanoa hainanensis TaxID=560556 RepID=A0A239PEX5_9ACTN|nr:VWA domain-containing protein [Asanoa hainanensis]SNT65208.1 von Willebrand factor type A domain-containing protein [Asanoa hainanensis]
MRMKLRGAGVIAAAMALVLVSVGVYFGYRQVSQPGCSGEAKLNVAAASEIAPAIEKAAKAWVDGGAQADGVCVAVNVIQQEPVDVAAVVAGKHGVSLAGVGLANGTATMPDVWVPDSSTWLLRLTSAAQGFSPTNGQSIARSPVVVAMPEPVAQQIGWPQKKISWLDLLGQLTTGTTIKPGIVEPTRDAAGLSGLLALGAQAGTLGAQAPSAQTAVLRALASGKSALREDLLAKFPRSTDPASIAQALSVAPLSEEDVVQYNSAKPPIPLAALYLEPAPTSLDYPYAVMPGTDPMKAKAAEGLFRVLTAKDFKNDLGAQHLRAADGTWGDGFEAPAGAPSPAGTPQVTKSGDSGGSAAGSADPAVVDRTLATWTAVTLPARMLAVIDISGTMGGKVPSAGNATRMQLTQQAATRGLGLFSDDWAVGLWVFSTNLGGGKDYKELVPIQPVSSGRSALLGKLATIQPKKGGDTGLYDTILAAYKNVQKGWQSGRVNSIVMLTDGIGNDDPDGGISQAGLIKELNSIKDKSKPVQLIIIGLGDEVNRGPLDQITKVTGGGVFVAEDPAKIGDIFLQAISRRPNTAN